MLLPAGAGNYLHHLPLIIISAKYIVQLFEHYLKAWIAYTSPYADHEKRLRKIG
jgi:hypothetical protein